MVPRSEPLRGRRVDPGPHRKLDVAVGANLEIGPPRAEADLMGTLQAAGTKPGDGNSPRRRDRAVDDEAWMLEFLHRAEFGFFAVADDGRPYVVPNLFVADAAGTVIYLHSARTGQSPSTFKEGTPVCFTVASMGRLLPADTALEFSVEYASVTMRGRVDTVRDAAEAERGLQLLLDKYCPHLRPDRDYRAITMDELRRTAVFRIDVEGWSAKRKTEADDFPGAFYFSTRPDSLGEWWRPG